MQLTKTKLRAYSSPRIPKANRVYELLLSYDCNAKCGFCYNPPLTEALLQQSVPFSRAAELLTKARSENYDGVWFTGGEPTLRSDLDKLLLLAKKLGFTRIQVASNGINLAKPTYTKHLVSAGLNYARISLHAANAEIHDRLLKVPGAFDKALAAIRSLQKSGVYVGVNFVVTSENVIDMPDFFHYCLENLRISDFDVIFLHQRGMMELNQQLALKYTASVKYLRLAWKKIVKKKAGHYPTLINIPPYVAPELRPWIGDWSMDHEQDTLSRPLARDINLMQMKLTQRMKSSSCRECILDSKCLGFEQEYAQNYGTDEFVPIKKGKV
jgi:MoaA/NifB/PqqE/SkfB family radical SAM enzyme